MIFVKSQTSMNVLNCYITTLCAFDALSRQVMMRVRGACTNVYTQAIAERNPQTPLKVAQDRR